jgi:hypothetical protein
MNRMMRRASLANGRRLQRQEWNSIQFFPRQSELVDKANIYWLWILEGDQT